MLHVTNYIRRTQAPSFTSTLDTSWEISNINSGSNANEQLSCWLQKWRRQWEERMIRSSSNSKIYVEERIKPWGNTRIFSSHCSRWWFQVRPMRLPFLSLLSFLCRIGFVVFIPQLSLSREMFFPDCFLISLYASKSPPFSSFWFCCSWNARTFERWWYSVS